MTPGRPGDLASPVGGGGAWPELSPLIALLGSRITADTGEPDDFGWTEHVLGAPGYRLAGGTDEIQRNIIGERGLGLPREPRFDKGVPYSKLPRSG